MNNLKDILMRQKNILTLAMLLTLLAILPGKAVGGLYLNGAHGSSAAGVKRSSISALDYVRGNCAHCHEQHASINGDDTRVPSPYVLFYDNYVGQTDNICLQCHVDLNGVQSGGIFNRSYSYRAGGWTADLLDDIKEAFSFVAPASSHNLANIKTFIEGQLWGYTADANPCAACHNPHAAQGDPLASPNSAKSSGTRGWLVSRPSQHSKNNKEWGLWGDNISDDSPYGASTERMSNYTTNYQVPFRFGSISTYEPDGSNTIEDQKGANLTDFDTFCTDCHNATNSISSTNLGTLRKIDWANEKHGKGNADTSLCGDDPYHSGASGLGKVLSCLDCHEPHGSPNAFLIRKEVNGGVLGGTIGSFSTTDWHYLCDRCHQDDKEINPSSCQEDRYYISHHSDTGCNSDHPYNPSMCPSCHGSGGGGSGCTADRPKKICTNCHFHGSSVSGNRTF